MNTKIKMSMILIITLIIGMVMGALMQSYYMRQHLKKRVRHLRTSEGFVKHFADIIEPTAEQQPKIEAILLEAHKKFDKRFSPQLKRFKNIADTMKMELKPILTDQQYEALQKHMKRMAGPPFRPRGNRRKNVQPHGE